MIFHFHFRVRFGKKIVPSCLQKATGFSVSFFLNQKGDYYIDYCFFSFGLSFVTGNWVLVL